jgi:site-specific recombinase XerD
MKKNLIELTNSLTELKNNFNIEYFDLNELNLISDWLLEYNQSVNTFNSYRQAIERFILFLSENQLTLKSLNRNIITKYSDWLKSPTPESKYCTGGARYSRTHINWKPFVNGLTDDSIKLNLGILSILYDYLISIEYLTKNPFRFKKYKRTKISTQEKYLTNEQILLLFKYIKNSELEMWRKVRYKWIFTLFLLTGLRKTEASNLVMADFIKRKDKWWLNVIGKGNKKANIPVTEELIDALSEYRLFNNLSALPGPEETNIPVIMRKLNKQKVNIIDYADYSVSDDLLYSEIKFLFQNIYKELKIEDPYLANGFKLASTHWLRHTSATLQIESNVPLHIVKENLRHNEISTTMRYVHTNKDIQHAEISNKFKLKK